MRIKNQRGPARAQATRAAPGYPSDLADAQWLVIAAYLPADQPGRRGRPRVWPLRRIIEAILYLDRTGCAWRYLPADFPPWKTVYGYFAAWRDDGTSTRLHVHDPSGLRGPRSGLELMTPGHGRGDPRRGLEP